MTVRRGNKMEEEEEEDEGNRQLTFDCLETKRKREHIGSDLRRRRFRRWRRCRDG